ncbi:unnamed protein product [Nippostrongylus brasiliensis]|uniref:Uncharacterized protein n=1 Tax=Nippostrongylus brasiliensis TaxID=27835 RepID=A0A0N4XCL3_NIPBR|nr:unnamed protein product [Nippostrongylus brasiliensis]
MDQSAPIEKLTAPMQNNHRSPVKARKSVADDQEETGSDQVRDGVRKPPRLRWAERKESRRAGECGGGNGTYQRDLTHSIIVRAFGGRTAGRLLPIGQFERQQNHKYS